MPYKDPIYRKYHDHKKSARGRGVGFELSFEEWNEIWEKSGHSNERGCHKGQYVMARNGDKGPYAIGNVEIITCDENIRRRVFSEEVKRRIGNAALGRKLTPEHKAKIGKGNKGLVFSEQRRINISIAKLGWVPSKETRTRMSIGAKKRQEREKNLREKDE